MEYLGNCRTDMRQIHTEDVFRPSLGRVCQGQRSKFNATKDKKRHFRRIPREPLNGFAPNSRGKRVSSLARTNVNVKVKGQRSWLPKTKTWFSGYISGTAEPICAKFTWKTCLVTRSDEFKGHGQIPAVCVRFMFGKTSLL